MCCIGILIILLYYRTETTELHWNINYITVIFRNKSIQNQKSKNISISTAIKYIRCCTENTHSTIKMNIFISFIYLFWQQNSWILHYVSMFFFFSISECNNTMFLYYPRILYIVNPWTLCINDIYIVISWLEIENLA